jgi:hypothetical protein
MQVATPRTPWGALPPASRMPRCPRQTPGPFGKNHDLQCRTGLEGLQDRQPDGIPVEGDRLLPIEDSIITATQGNRKDLVTRGNRGHMGNPGAEDILYNWLDKAVAEQP